MRFQKTKNGVDFGFNYKISIFHLFFSDILYIESNFKIIGFF